MKIKTTIGDFDAYLLFFARSRIASQIFAMGPADQVAFDDLVSLARLTDDRITEALAAQGTASVN